MAKRTSRNWIILVVIIGVVGALTYAFWPKPISVDLGVVERAPMVVTIDEDAKTRVQDVYTVSTPVAGRLQRVEVEPGDMVIGGTSIVASMLPTNPAALDVRSREQALATTKAAEAALQLARAEHERAVADKELSEIDLQRTTQLFEKEVVSRATLDRAQSVARSAAAVLDTTAAAISMRGADLEIARAQLISFDDQGNPSVSRGAASIPLRAPVSGRVLQVKQVSETTLPAGTPILEIGDISNGMEIIVELLSSDAVKVGVGDRVIVDNWGGPKQLGGTVTRVDPWGYTKYSALGVEEQRVGAIIEFTDPWEQRQSLGHGFRVEVKIVVWEDQNALVVPSSALFREANDWAVFTVEDGKASKRNVKIGQNNGLQAQVLEGLAEQEVIVLYPGANLVEGAAVEQRIVQ
ncbi:efflux RND transporter periplasmic adaptor subunit [Maritalea porphyrae]|uniref:efflux RND transporter periplasmic adaptor subunit n=1 Tax=Maritalea porphyrae TaxID=880732 RepID=UPI0022AE55A4|nr:HlyD family efflux transporter periplasmic adaptor subunit [Maritalea porphyrae]MCZ4271210.1 HlyD family efflux transporter periplasmic adaptor subunit [Maritalea porphyrae]